MDNKIDLGELRHDFDDYKNVPKQLYEYIVNVIKKGIKENLLQVLLGPSREEFLSDIDYRFKKASEILRLSPQEIAKALDFSPADVGKGRIDAFFAELRVIFWLHYQGFQNIIPLRSKSKRRADLYAELNSSKYIIEVFCMIKGVYKWPNHQKRRHDLIQYFIDRAQEKKAQMDKAAKDSDCDKKILALVLDSEMAVALRTRTEFLAMLRYVSNTLNWGKDYYFALITGKESSLEGPDDVVYPSI